MKDGKIFVDQFHNEAIRRSMEGRATGPERTGEVVVDGNGKVIGVRWNER
jgi:hypothetical protein